MIALLSFALSLICYGIRELALHGQLRWSKDDDGFWGERSYERKYTYDPPKDNWYYKFFKIKQRERFLFSTTFLVSLTDGYHLMQSLQFIFEALGIYLAGLVHIWNYWLYDLAFTWLSVLFLHWLTRRLLSK